MQIEKIKTDNDRTINLRTWLPEGEIRQTVFLSHGMGEHVDRYRLLADALTKQGVAVFGANHRGHGEEADTLGYFADKDGWSLLLSDLDAIADYITEQYQLPPVLIGHSMGSFAARHYAIEHGDKLSGLVLCGSNHQGRLMFQLGTIAAKIEKMRIGGAAPSKFLEKLSFGDFNKNIKPLRTDQDWLSRDPELVDEYLNDKLCGFTVTPQFWIDFLGGLNEISRPSSFRKIPAKLPVYVISGDADPVSRYGKGLLDLVSELRKGGLNNVQHKLYPQARHELFNEINRAEVYRDLLNWIEADTL